MADPSSTFRGNLKRDFFSARAPTDSHKKSISGVPSDWTPVDDLYHTVFGHHLVDRQQKEEHVSPYVTPESITRLFHEKHYSPRILWHAHGNDDISLEQLFRRITKIPFSEEAGKERWIGPNRVSVLIGRVGVGKTTLVSQIMTRFARELTAEKTFPIRVDVEAVAGKEASKQKFFSAFYVKLYDAMSSTRLLEPEKLKELFELHLPTFESEVEEVRAKQFVVASRQLIVDFYLETNFRLLIFLDNIDNYYYLFDRGGFSEEGDRLRFKSMDKLASIIEEFRSPDGSLDGAGLCVLVCIRRHTLDYLDVRRGALPGRSFSPDEEGSNVFRMQRCPPEDVITSRTQLLKDVLELQGAVPARIQTYQNLEKLKFLMVGLVDQSEDAPKRLVMINDLSKLTSHGHRALIDHFAGYRWAFSDPNIMRRFFKTYSPAVITFMLNNKIRYSQVESRFPNLFLVRGDVEVSSESRVPDRLKQPHKHTYWLKYLVCQYIHLKKSKDQEITPAEIVDIFSPKENGEGCFERHIVELILGSLSQVDISAMIEPEFRPSVDGQSLAIRDIDLTDRGKFLIERFAIDFTYLQLVVEDYLLEIPDVVFQEFRYEKIDYEYLASRNSYDYANRTVDQINLKTKWVFLFLEILEVSLKYERMRRADVFRSLDARGLAMPNFYNIRRRIVHSMHGIAERLKARNIVQRAEDNLSAAASKREQLEKFFKEAYIERNV